METIELTRQEQAEQADAGDSGLLLISGNDEAFAVRVLAARDAVSSLDLMYYIWRDDDCGRTLLKEVVAAAKRGVQVRMLIDDINPQSSDATYLALDSHPNINLKLFNPSGMRNRSLLRTFELVTRMFAMTRRMHGKAWIADRKVAIVGGRNIGNEYFDAADTNFRDLDLLMTGDAVAQTCAIFDRYWNHEAAMPIRLLNPTKVSKDAHRGIGKRQPLELETTLKGRRSVADLIATSPGLHRLSGVQVLADPPDKVKARGRRNWLVNTLAPMLQSSERMLEIVSPYFIPSRYGLRVLSGLVGKGVSVTVLTNSLAATDVAAVHGAYSNYRRKLLRAGIKLFEQQPFDEQNGKMSVFGSKGASLHTKAFAIDSRAGFIGSFNFDPRSVSLNAEMGVYFEHPPLVAELCALFETEKRPKTSFRVTLEHGRLVWRGDDDNGPRTFHSEPYAGIGRRLLAFIVRWLPIESQL